MYHVLIIGAGTMGRFHAQAYAGMKDVRVSGIVDRDLRRAEELAKPLRASVFTTFEEAHGTVPAEVVDICLPTPLHKPFVLKAVNAGKHVICEKPLARNLEDAREMIDACREKGMKLFVGHVVRFFPEYVRARELVKSGRIGDVTVVRTGRGGSFPGGWNDWYADYQASGGLVLDLIIHDFDYLRWCFGEVERVFAKSLIGRGYARMEYALVTLRFRSGVIAHVEGTWSHEGFSSRFEIAGKTGIIAYDSAKDRPLLVQERGTEVSAYGVAVPESPLNENPYARQLGHFLHCLKTGEPPVVTAEDAYRALEIALGALHSIETGQPVTLEAGVS